MAKGKRKRTKAEADVDINLTPMIDVVFNLIIFFMVITDMTQQDLEILTLPKAEKAQKDDGKDKERLIINIVNEDSEASKGRVDPNRPPIFMNGKQVDSLDDMRAKLRKRADPRKFGDDTQPAVSTNPDIFPSRKPLLVRCDQGANFGWVQAVMQYITFVPGRNRVQELEESPLIRKLEIAIAERDDGN